MSNPSVEMYFDNCNVMDEAQYYSNTGLTVYASPFPIDLSGKSISAFANVSSCRSQKNQNDDRQKQPNEASERANLGLLDSKFPKTLGEML